MGYTDFEGVEPECFLSYVLFNTARHARQDRKFEMRYLPDGWRRDTFMASTTPAQSNKETSVPAKRLTLPAAIERDIKRLNAVLPSWPSSFHGLNAARNYVRQFCYVLRFEYTGHPNVELHIFKLYVHFNTAKHAYKAGKFALDEDGEAMRVAGVGQVKRGGDGERSVSRGSDETLTEEKVGVFGVSTAAYDVDAGKRDEVDRSGEVEALNTVTAQDDAAIDSPQLYQLVEVEDEPTRDEEDAVTAQIQCEEKEALARKKADPFKVRSVTPRWREVLTMCCRISSLP